MTALTTFSDWSLIRVFVDRGIDTGIFPMAREAIGAALADAPAEVLSVYVRMVAQPTRALGEAVRIRVNINIGGRLVHVEALGPTASSAVELAGSRVRNRLRGLAAHFSAVE
ncbi:MAG: hypothetical protein HOQ24_08055 [Mycobacteriaceae bacterium]|nr:hypothetical protein [Mycobacteriaceae bacterium]